VNDVKQGPVFDDLAAYARAELAMTHKSTAGSQAQLPEGILEPALAQVEREGYVVFERLLDEATTNALRSDLRARLPPQRGRNNFEGFATQRIYGLLEATSACNLLVEHPLILGLLDRILEPNYLLSQLQAINILPGEARQPLHHDDAFYPWPRPRPALGAATIWAIDPFTEDNGATVVIPKSHLWDNRRPSDDQVEKVVMPAGSVLFFVGTLWHGGGANETNAPRLCVSAQYCAPWCRQQENFSLSVSRERARACSEHIQRMLGYSIHPPFMGFVNGMHPKRLLG
jgi:ectoine hydroxylase-related dioxygenase (phytanoyl-CoA dioxygenase family)